MNEKKPVSIVKKIPKIIPKKEETPEPSDYQINILQKLKNIIKDNEELCQTIESCIYQNCVKLSEKYRIDPKWDNSRFVKLYLERSKSIILNLDPESYIKNYYLLPKVISGEISPEELLELKPQRLNPERWKTTIDKLLHEAQIASSNQSEQGASDLFKCGKCKQSKCTYFQLQTRSSDEPMTTFITCIVCGNHWKE